MSCKLTSIDEFDKTIPVNPPIVNKIIKPIDQSMGVSIHINELFIVAIQLNTLIPVGIAMIIVAEVK